MRMQQWLSKMVLVRVCALASIFVATTVCDNPSNTSGNGDGGSGGSGGSTSTSSSSSSSGDTTSSSSSSSSGTGGGGAGVCGNLGEPCCVGPDVCKTGLDCQDKVCIEGDRLYIGDNSKFTVKEFDTRNGVYMRDLVAPGSGGLHGAMGILVPPGGDELWVVNQNVNLPMNGAILRYDRTTGEFLSALVSPSSTGSPSVPRGMVISPAGELIVADNGELTPPPYGRLPRYNTTTGAFLGDFDTSGFLPPFMPRGVVVGPDGLLYVSGIDAIGENGYVIRFDLTTKTYKDTFITATAATQYAGGLHKPEGIVFGPDGKLYVTSARYMAGTASRIMIYDSNGANVNHIDLDDPAQQENYAQAMVFGPDGRLFVAMTITGEVRSYDVATLNYTSFVKPGTGLEFPWYLSFGKTNPATLAYEP